METRISPLPDPAVRESAGKPVAWSVMQGLTIAAIPALLIGGPYVAQWAEKQAPRGDGTLDSLVLGVFLALAAWAAAILATTVRRMPIARWLGGAFVLLLASIGMLALLLLAEDAGRREPMLLHPSAGIVPAILLACYWLYAFALSDKARRYVGRIAASSPARR